MPGYLSKVLRRQGVRAEEKGLVFWILVWLASTQFGLGLAFNAADAIFIHRSGVEYLPNIFIALAFALIIVNVVYLPLLTGPGRERFLVGSSAFFGLIVCFERGVISLDSPWFSPVLWLSTYIIAQATFIQSSALISSACEARQSKRFHFLFAGGSILGLIGGHFATLPVVSLMGVENLLSIWAGVLFLNIPLTYAIHRAFALKGPQKQKPEMFENIGQSLALLRSLPLAGYLAATTVLLWGLYFFTFFPYAAAAGRAFPSEESLARFLGLFSGASLSLGLFLLLLLSRLLFAWLGVKNVLPLMPLVYLLGLAPLSARFNFSFALLARFISMAALYAFGIASYQALYKLTPPARQEELQNTIERLLVPSGVALAGILLFMLGTPLGWQGTFALALFLAALYLFLSLRMRQSYASALVRLLRDGRDEIFNPEEVPFGHFEDKGALATAAQALKDPDPGVRRLATEILGRMKPMSGLAYLIQALNDPESTVRVTSLKALGKLREAALGILPVIAHHLTDPDPEARAQAISTLSHLAEKFDGRTMDRLRALLQDESPQVRAQAAALLIRLGEGAESHKALELMGQAMEGESRAAAIAAYGRLGRSRRFLPQVIEAISDSDPLVRRAAATTLGQLGDLSAVPHLIRALEDEDKAVRKRAVQALVALGEDAVPTLLENLSAGPPTIQENILEVLGHLRARGVRFDLKPLASPLKNYLEAQIAEGYRHLAHLQALESQEAHVRSGAYDLLLESLETRLSALESRLASTLGLLGDQATMRLVSRTLAWPDLRASAIETIKNTVDKNLTRRLLPLLERNVKEEAKLGDEIETLGEIIDGPDSWMRAVAIYAAGQLVLTPLRERIKNALHDEDWLVRETAVEAMARMEDSWEAIAETLQDSEVAVRRAAIRVLARLGPIPQARQALSKAAQEDEDRLVREGALRTLEQEEKFPMETLNTLSIMDRILFLKKVPLFSEASPEDLKALAHIAAEQVYPEHNIICRQGDPGGEMFIIVSGKLEVVVESENGEEKLLATRYPGEYVGEMAILDGAPRSASIRTAEVEARLLVIQERDFESILHERPEIALKVIEILSRRLRETTRWALDIG
ncbi:MAG: HEAT repeat domain-containing protein [Anaerolineae bacterium]